MQQALKLDKLFYCETCRAVFLFQSDVDDHAAMCGHYQIGAIDLD
jgi:hypothetical protein